MTATTTDSPAAAGPAAARRTRGWVLALGLLLIALGAVGAGSSALGTISTLVIAVLVISAGIGQVLLAFVAPHWKGWALHLAAAGLDLVIGVFLLSHPGDSVTDVGLLLAALLMVGGLQRALGALALRFPNWGWTLAAGGVALALGVCVWRGWAPDAWLIGLFVAVDFLLHGACWVLVSLAGPTPFPDLPGPDGRATGRGP